MGGILRTVAGFAVGIVGFALGGPLGFAAATLAFGLVFPIKQKAAAQSNANLEINTSEYDGPIPCFWGRMGNVGGNIVTVAKDKKGQPAGVIKRTKKKKVGGKGGGKGGATVEEEQFYLVAEYAIGCAGDGGALMIDRIIKEDAEGLNVLWERTDVLGTDIINNPDYIKGILSGEGVYKVDYTPEYVGDILVSETISSPGGGQIVMQLGTEAQQPSAFMEEFWGAGKVCPHRGVAKVCFNRVRIYSQPTFTFEVRCATTGRREIIKSRLLACGIPQSRLKLTQIEGDVEGAAVLGREPARDFCEKLASRVMCGFSFNNARVEDYSKMNPHIWILEDSDLAARESNGDGGRQHGGRSGNEIHNKTPFEMKGEEEFHSEVSASFYDVDHGYEQNTAIATRLSAQHSNPQSYDLPEATRLGDALAWSRMMLDEDWAADRAVEVKLLPKHCQMVPGNVMRVPHRNNFGGLTSLYYLITEQGIEPSGLLTFRGVPWRSGLHEQAGVISEDGWQVPRPIAPGKVYFQLFDCAPLDDSHTSAPGFYVIATWPSDVPGVEFGPVAQGTGLISGYSSANGTNNVLPTRGTFGICEGTLGDFDGDPATDWDDSELIIRLRGTVGVEDETDADIENGYVNLLRVGDEIIQFVHATYLGEMEDGDGDYWQRYEISRFKRARRATDWAISSHTTGEEVTLLDTALMRVTIASWAIGEAIDYHLLYESSAGASVENVSYTANGVSLKPFSPTTLDATQSGNEWTLSAVPRTRFMGWEINPAMPILTAPPDTDTYVFEVMDGATVKRAIPGNGTGTIFVNYTEAQQVEDWGSVQSTINVRAMRLSSVVTPVSESGRGYEASATFTAGAGSSSAVNLYFTSSTYQVKIVIAGTPGQVVTFTWNNGATQTSNYTLTSSASTRTFYFFYGGGKQLQITGDLSDITFFRIKDQEGFRQIDGLSALAGVETLDFEDSTLTVLPGLGDLTSLTDVDLDDCNFNQAELEAQIDAVHANRVALGTNGCAIYWRDNPGSSGAATSRATQLSEIAAAGCTVAI